MPKINLKKPGRLTLALTGNFGSGKSTVLACFKKLGAQTVDCDRIAKELTSGGNPRLDAELSRKFGPHVIASQGGVDRAAMAKLVFSDPKKRKILESILHPQIMSRVQALLASGTEKIRVVEVPLLFEAGHESAYDAAIVVKASPAVSKRRLSAAGWNASQIRNRLKNQMPMQVKCQKADFILDNSFSRQNVFKQVSQMYQACQSVVEGRGK